MGRSVKIFVPVAAVLMVLSACGEEGGGSTGGGAGKSVTVTAEDFAFSPDSLDLDAGEEVELTFENRDDVDHSFTIEDPSFEIEAEGGASTTGTFTVPDSGVEWICKYHPDQMKGTIEVGGAAGGGGTEMETETSPTDDDMTEGSNENDKGYDY